MNKDALVAQIFECAKFLDGVKIPAEHRYIMVRLHWLIYYRGHDVDYFEERKRLRHCYGCRKLTNRWFPARQVYLCKGC